MLCAPAKFGKVIWTTVAPAAVSALRAATYWALVEFETPIRLPWSAVGVSPAV